METKKMISEGLSINQLEERLEMSSGILVCCSDAVQASCCGLLVPVNVDVNVTVNK